MRTVGAPDHAYITQIGYSQKNAGTPGAAPSAPTLGYAYARDIAATNYSALRRKGIGGGFENRMRGADLLERMRANPQADWTIAAIELFCRAYGLTITPPRRGSHYKVRDPRGGPTLTIPARRPIKAIYIRALVALAEQVGEEKGGQ